jgi:cold shock CspA family protein
MNGTMMWFNRVKGIGVIRTADGRVGVETDGFAHDEVPTGRCAGMRVSFRCEGEGESARAVGVTFVKQVEPRRARLGHGRGGAARAL